MTNTKPTLEQLDWALHMANKKFHSVLAYANAPQNVIDTCVEQLSEASNAYFQEKYKTAYALKR